MSDINLRPHQNSSLLQQDKAASLLRRVSFFCLSLTAFISVALFILTVQSSVSQEREQEEALLATLSLSANRISRNVIIEERLNSINAVLSERNKYNTYLDQIIAIAPPTISINSIQIKKNVIQITANSSTFEISDAYMNNLVGLKEREKKIKSVVLQNYSFQNESGKYYFTLDITML